MNDLQRQYFIQMIEAGGGVVQDNKFVIKPGCMLMVKPYLTSHAQDLMNSLNIDSNPEYLRLAEFNSRITYMSFKKEKSDSTEYNRQMVEDFQHLSVHAHAYVTFLLSGVSLEAETELISHREATVARLTTSNTKAMTEPLYRIVASDADQLMTQKITLGRMDEVRSIRNDDIFYKNLPLETSNSMDPGCKAVALTYTMSLKDFHKFFIGRCPKSGNEIEVRQLAKLMCDILHEEFPVIIKDFETYAGKSNGEKYHA